MYTIYSKPSCPQCDQVLNIMIARKVAYDMKKLDIDYTRAELDKVVADSGSPPPRSFPVVFCDGLFIGGITEVKQLALWGKL